ncbi:homoserine dehydrogenase [Candidatus Liberibacter sp.]|uniref:homoserine dehydrogenase n=1 Tax=Candidatus Liberibacter sp. TaxID=34022 RepID=UPI0015F50E9D|nr:homoserine dehydrogenase [Candidatus Liberibacter sp.]MBA5723716.1 homoserine dehydrogenase [Candidatus Liberibacter sp.]
MEGILKVGIVGLGTVGSSLVRMIQQRVNQLQISCGRKIVVSAVCARDRSLDRGVDFSDAEWFDNPATMADKAEIDVFVELIGGEGDPAYSAIRVALMRGCHVVTANKALLANHGVELAILAEKNAAIFSFEAAVAGGIPIIKVLKDSLPYNEIVRIYGILNGTCNYILSYMDKMDVSFEDCLREAQSCGYAEDNPEFDICGADSAHKLAILSSIAFGVNTSIDGMSFKGISSITLEDIRSASDFGYRIKLLAMAQRTDDGGIERRVYPAMLKCDSSMAFVDGITNAVVIETDILGKLLMVGPGAGGDATASAVLGDIIDIAKIHQKKSLSFALGRPASSLTSCQSNRVNEQKKEYFIRMKIRNFEGVLDTIASQMDKFCISLRILTCPHSDTSFQECSVVMITNAISETSVYSAIEFISNNNSLIEHPQVICIENL